jgi:glucokinase
VSDRAKRVFIGTDGGATTTKIGGVWGDATTISTELVQRPTGAEHGPLAVMQGWATAVSAFLERHGLDWDQVEGVGAAMPGPQRSYGVLERGPNLPESFAGFDVLGEYRKALAARAGRDVPLVVGNDGNMGGVAEARRVRGDGPGTVLMLAPGSGLGCAYIDARGLPLDGDTLAGMEASHMPAPLHLLGAEAYPCGCGRTWGCVEIYTSLAGLPYLLAARLPSYPGHPLAASPLAGRQRAFALRGLAQEGDALATELFDFQARAMGLHVASLAMALDPTFVVIGGGLMDPAATSGAFRERYLRILWESAVPFLWPAQRTHLRVVPAALGDLSQAIGAALVALYHTKG